MNCPKCNKIMVEQSVSYGLSYPAVKFTTTGCYGCGYTHKTSKREKCEETPEQEWRRINNMESIKT